MPVISGVSDYEVPAVRGTSLGIMAGTEQKTVGGCASAEETSQKPYEDSYRVQLRLCLALMGPVFKASLSQFFSSPAQLLTGELVSWLC